MLVTVLAGGVGAARFLAGLMDVVAPANITAIVNTGDDMVLHGLKICPDLDTVTYTLADAINPDTGWGLANESWAAMSALDRYSGQSWFRLGDQDLATHLYRTQRLSEGISLSQVTSEITKSWELGLTLLPMSDDPAPTLIQLRDSGEQVSFQEWFVGQQHQSAVSAVGLDAARQARPAPGVIDAIEDADRIVICPSNPIVSIGPILAVPGISAALQSRRVDTAAVSPIVAGRALKGPADRLMTELGHEATVAGVARIYQSYAYTLAIDVQDAGMAGAVESAGMAPMPTPSIMNGRAAAARLARACVEW